jgi:hypothetical protein
LYTGYQHAMVTANQDLVWYDGMKTECHMQM